MPKKVNMGGLVATINTEDDLVKAWDAVKNAKPEGADVDAFAHIARIVRGFKQEHVITQEAGNKSGLTNPFKKDNPNGIVNMEWLERRVTNNVLLTERPDSWFEKGAPLPLPFTVEDIEKKAVEIFNGWGNKTTRPEYVWRTLAALRELGCSEQSIEAFVELTKARDLYIAGSGKTVFDRSLDPDALGTPIPSKAAPGEIDHASRNKSNSASILPKEWLVDGSPPAFSRPEEAYTYAVETFTNLPEKEYGALDTTDPKKREARGHL